jgi:predicted nucleic acid-binding protein
MDVVVDANIVISALIKRSYTLELMFNDNLRLFSPEFLIEEILEHRDEILLKSGLEENDFDKYIEVLLRIIHLIDTSRLLPYINDARRICSDEDDLHYVAVSIYLNIPIWTNDKGIPNSINSERLKELLH